MDRWTGSFEVDYKRCWLSYKILILDSTQIYIYIYIYMYIKKKIALLKRFFFSPNENGNVIYFKGEKKQRRNEKRH